MSEFAYQNGFLNHFESEAAPDSLPKLGNTPQKASNGLYTEQLSGTAFTMGRKSQRTWCYRILPSVNHEPFSKYTGNPYLVGDFNIDSPNIEITPQQLRWDPFTLEDESKQVDFVDGLRTISGAGSSQTKNGLAIHMYMANTEMKNKSFYNSDGDFLIVPQLGTLIIRTEFGIIEVPPNFVCVIQRGIKFSVNFKSQNVTCRGYVCEIFKGHWDLPERGPIGANGLANEKDFQTPVASYENTSDNYTIVNKFMGRLFSFNQNHSPYDVVAYSGNYLPYRYDLSKFNTIGSISYDHPDPSIFTVLTCASDVPGTAIADFVIFPPRWLVATETFRPPYFHRNCMSEFMGNIMGNYDAKAEGFNPGGASLHNMNSAHGPDAETFQKASNADLKPEKIGEGSMSFMFESGYQLATTSWAIKESGKVQQDYWKAWKDLKKNYISK